MGVKSSVDFHFESLSSFHTIAQSFFSRSYLCKSSVRDIKNFRRWNFTKNISKSATFWKLQEVPFLVCFAEFHLIFSLSCVNILNEFRFFNNYGVGFLPALRTSMFHSWPEFCNKLYIWEYRQIRLCQNIELRKGHWLTNLRFLQQNINTSNPFFQF